jgi:hypothetical protein
VAQRKLHYGTPAGPTRILHGWIVPREASHQTEFQTRTLALSHYLAAREFTQKPNVEKRRPTAMICVLTPISRAAVQAFHTRMITCFPSFRVLLLNISELGKRHAHSLQFTFRPLGARIGLFHRPKPRR